jgi:hypothetical protein
MVLLCVLSVSAVSCQGIIVGSVPGALEPKASPQTPKQIGIQGIGWEHQAAGSPAPATKIQQDQVRRYEAGGLEARLDLLTGDEGEDPGSVGSPGCLPYDPRSQKQDLRHHCVEQAGQHRGGECGAPIPIPRDCKDNRKCRAVRPKQKYRQ